VPWCRWCHPATAGRLVTRRCGSSRRRSHTAKRRAERAGRHIFVFIAVAVLRLERELELLELLVRERPAVPALQLVEEGRFGSPLLLIVGAVVE
jgi:CelD/BcsL family acetyltransferase involved in cellulose biosynthesis